MCKGVLLRSGVPSGAARFGMMSLLGIHFLCRYSTYIDRKKASSKFSNINKEHSYNY